MDIADALQSAIKKALIHLGVVGADISLEHPGDLTHGDYSTNVALVYAKQLKKKPQVLAEEIADFLTKEKNPMIDKIEIAGPGFINFYLSSSFFTQNIQNILEASEQFGAQAQLKKKKILVEYSSPNIAKPFTIGHLRSTIIGDSLATILSFLGHDVIRDNHLGDWGTQFGKQIVAIKRWSSLDEIRSSKNQMRSLVDLYVRFHTEAEKDTTLEDEAREWFVKLEDGDEEARQIYAVCVEISKKYFEMIYARLNVSPFDTAHGEAFYEPVISEVLKDIEKAGIAKESEGARLIFFKKDIYPPLMIQKKDGATLYATRDLATDKWRREEYGEDIIIVNETGTEQSLYFSQLFEVEEMLGYFEKDQRIHIGHGFIRSKDGKMSTRKGNVIWLEEVLDEAERRAAVINADTAKLVGVGALKFNDLKRESSQDVVFDWEEVVNLKGDSGPYLQYSCVRARSIVAKAREAGIPRAAKLSLETVSPLAQLLYRFPEVVARAGREYAPHYIATYLLELAAAFNGYYAHTKIVEGKDPASVGRVALTEAFSIVMANGLRLLGIEVPEKM